MGNVAASFSSPYSGWKKNGSLKTAATLVYVEIDEGECSGEL